MTTLRTPRRRSVTATRMRDLPSPAAIHEQQADADDWIQGSRRTSDAIRYSPAPGRNGRGADFVYPAWDGILQSPFTARRLVSRSFRAQWISGDTGRLVRRQPAKGRLCPHGVQGAVREDTGNQRP